MTQIKICGIQRLDDALVAAQAGADFVGLAFVPGRRRRITEADAQSLVLGLRESAQQVPKVVGLFADQSLDEVNRIADRCALDLAQLCGQEPPDYCAQVKVPVIKVVHILDSQPSSEVIGIVEGLQRDGHLVTLDRKVAGLQGGTGRSFDWSIAQEMARRGLPFLLAGGLTPDNVADAVRTVRPWGVDVSSGVETSKAKDPHKIQAFINVVHTADLEQRSSTVKSE